MTRGSAFRKLLGLAAGGVLAVVCPPAAVAVGGVLFLKGARRFAQTGDIQAAGEMLTAYGDVSSLSTSTGDGCENDR